jgi:hypothetical protein
MLHPRQARSSPSALHRRRCSLGCLTESPSPVMTGKIGAQSVEVKASEAHAAKESFEDTQRARPHDNES